MSAAGIVAPITEWGRWFRHLAQLPDGELARRDIAEINLKCAADLPGTDNSVLGDCRQKVDDWAILVERYTEHLVPHFRSVPERFENSLSRFRVVAMAECLQRYIGIRYNTAFLEGDYDASDSRNLFIHGVLSGFGGTCVTLPVLYCAIGRRLGYPLSLGETSEHFFCRWDDESEHFCFDATSRGSTIRGENYYRQWPKPITPDQERNNGFIRSLTRREELAVFAEARGKCLLDNFRFEAAIEAHFLAHQVAPHKHSVHDACGLAFFTAKLWEILRSLPDPLKDAPIEQSVYLAADYLQGSAVAFFRAHAVRNILRIVHNRRRRGHLARRDAAFQELVTNE